MSQAEILELFDQYHNMVYRIALTATRSVQDAEDVTQTVFLKLLDGCPAPQPGKERAWLAQVTVNACRNLMRSFWNRKTEPLDENISFPAPEEALLFDTVMALPTKLRIVIHLHYYEGYTCAEIGQMLRLSSSAVSMRLHRARNMRRSSLKEENYEKLVSADF